MSFLSTASSIASKVSSTGNDIILNGYIPQRWHQKIQFKTALILLLPCLSLLGLCTTWLSARSNGVFTYIFGLIGKDGALLPSSDDILVTSYTGIRLFDHRFTSYVILFAPVFNLENQALALFGVFTFGQLGASWTLVVLESMRQGNRGKWLRLVSIFGLMFQIITLAVTVPFWLLLHILTSPIAKPFPGNHASRVLFVDTMDLKVLPWAITLGYILPTILMTLPAPDWVTPLAHQNYIAFWQWFPVWTMIVHWCLKKLYNAISHYLADKRGNLTPKPQNTSYLKEVKYIYLFTLTLCIFTHLPVLFLALIPSWTLPTHFPTIALLATETISSVYIPAIPFVSLPFEFDTLVKHFLQYDLYIGFTALLLWATFLYRNATVERTLVDPDTSLPQYNARQILSGEVRRREEKLWKIIVLKIVAWTMVSGPMGALTVLLWERDAIVRQKIKQGI